MRKMNLFTLVTLVFSVSAQASYVLNCHERNAVTENNLVTDVRVNAAGFAYNKDGLTTLALPKIGRYQVNDYPDVIMTVSQDQLEFPTVEDVAFLIETDDTWTKVDIENVYAVYFGRISTTIKFSAVVTDFSGDTPESNGPITYQASCSLVNL